MTVLLEIKEKLKSIYAEYAYVIIIVLKFSLALMVFLSINRTIGFWEPLKSIFPILTFSLLCSLLSVKAIAIFAAAFILGHSYALGLEVLGVTVALLLILYLFFLRFDEKDGVALLLTPLALSLGIAAFVPICYGLKRKPASAVPITCGTVVFYYICMLSEKASVFLNADREDIFESMLNHLRILVDGLLENHLMFLNMAALILTICIVYVIRRLPLDHIWHIAIGTGAVVYLLTMISGGLFLDIEVSALWVVVGTLISIFLASIMEFFVLNVDYSRTERMEFEDDEYYYYVKAVPKLTISKPQREIKTISSGPEMKVPEYEEEVIEIKEQDTEAHAEIPDEKKESKLFVLWSAVKEKMGRLQAWLKIVVKKIGNLLTKG